MSTKQHAHAGHHKDQAGRVHAHVAPVAFYCAIFAALIALTFITVAVSNFDFGDANIIVAMVVATIKASLVAAFFMHLTHDRVFHTLIFLASFLFLGLFFLLTYDDVGRRGEIDEDYGVPVLPSTGAYAPGGLTPHEVGGGPPGVKNDHGEHKQE